MVTSTKPEQFIFIELTGLYLVAMYDGPEAPTLFKMLTNHAVTWTQIIKLFIDMEHCSVMKLLDNLLSL